MLALYKKAEVRLKIKYKNKIDKPLVPELYRVIEQIPVFSENSNPKHGLNHG
jgi:hypothetical protein